ncbi:MAG TPA: oxygen-independent coproporphyrinogen III oxidase [Sphingobacteriaceae bacterium]
MITSDLIKKYNVAAPRYTSYPTVPYWETELWSKEQWLMSIRKAYKESREDGISIYVHLPFCENLCTYCGCTTRITKNHKVEDPYIAAVIKEWQMYVRELGQKPRVKEIHLGGGTPTFFAPENLEKLMNGILENAEVVDGAEFSFEAHPANTTYAHLKSLYHFGFRRLSLGIQDFDPAVQEIINRRQTVEQVDTVTREARALGYTSINYDLIYGLPLQKLASVEDTISKVISLRPDRIAFYSYAHVPWIKPGQRRFTEADLPEDEEKRKLYERGRELLTDAGYYDVGMDHFALPTDSLYLSEKNKTLHRNFMGYTHQYTKLCIGLGVSSIGDSWYAFAQNIKVVEPYLKAVAEGRFPMFKGHVLTTDDLKRRKDILNIMCNGDSLLDSSDPSYATIRKRLAPLESDGLIRLERDRIHVTEEGKAFLRNICMAFDERLWDKQPQSQIFSMAV